VEVFLNPDGLVALLTLTALEIVLGIDNVVFISILSSRLQGRDRFIAQRIGMLLALVMRLGLLLTITWVMSLTQPLFTLLDRAFSGRDLILIVGGLVLLGKATTEIYEKLEVEHDSEAAPSRRALLLIVGQILVMDLVFSLDSVITAVGLANEVPIMVAAMVIAVVVMVVSAGAISSFVEAHPSVKILALAFLVLIGTMLVAEGFGQHVSKGYIYVAMAFSLGVELLNMRYRARRKPVQLHGRFEDERAHVSAG